jgi:hypothetical protein
LQTLIDSFSCQLEAILPGLAGIWAELPPVDFPPLDDAHPHNFVFDAEFHAKVEAASLHATGFPQSEHHDNNAEEKQPGLEIPGDEEMAAHLQSEEFMAPAFAPGASFDEAASRREEMAAHLQSDAFLAAEVAPGASFHAAASPPVDVDGPTNVAAVPLLLAARDAIRVVLQFMDPVARVNLATSCQTFYRSMDSTLSGLWRESSMPAQILGSSALTYCHKDQKFVVYLTSRTLVAVPVGTFVTVETIDTHGAHVRRPMAVQAFTPTSVQLIAADTNNCEVFVPRASHAAEESSPSQHYVFTMLHRNPDAVRMARMSIMTSKRALGLWKRPSRDPAEMRWALSVVQPVLLRGLSSVLRVDSVAAFSSSDDDE